MMGTHEEIEKIKIRDFSELELNQLLFFDKVNEEEDKEVMNKFMSNGIEAGKRLIIEETERSKGSIEVKWSVCSNGYAGDINEMKLELKSLNFEPNPPNRNYPFKVIVSGMVKVPIDSRTKLNYTIFFGILPIAKDSIPLCTLLKDLNESSKSIPTCPIEGNQYIESEYTVDRLPSQVPTGNYKIRLSASNPIDGDLFCYDIQGKIK